MTPLATTNSLEKMPAEDRACPDSSSDHAAAHVESRNSTANNSSEGRKRPEASHISGSQVRVMSKESFAKGFATINYDNLEKSGCAELGMCKLFT